MDLNRTANGTRLVGLGINNEFDDAKYIKLSLQDQLHSVMPIFKITEKNSICFAE